MIVGSAILAGIGGTILMDLGNFLCFKAGLIHKVNQEMIGRMMSGWLGGRFVYASPGELPAIAHPLLKGFGFHYAIGATLALFLALGMRTMQGGLPTFWVSLGYGVATSAISLGLSYPAVGMGLGGLKGGGLVAITSLVNHAFYGLGLGASFALIGRFSG